MHTVIHPTKPYADGILFDDLHGMTDETRNLLAARGVVFSTEFLANDRRYGGHVIATSWDAAEDIAFSRGLGEEIVGTMVETGFV